MNYQKNTSVHVPEWQQRPENSGDPSHHPETLPEP
ncbi:hypothetical protein ANCDUO_15794 [Ancylostoma duodenale]|uniref:Uncharacterized protein n=1 Tax=Ancylostoma duodenale TaxID=51022 RepID=A0A0C2CW14_9BILA|nr:hypothetical protein ANCDUO_15794 [Ancylostoma duodenale]